MDAVKKRLPYSFELESGVTVYPCSHGYFYEDANKNIYIPVERVKEDAPLLMYEIIGFEKKVKREV